MIQRLETGGLQLREHLSPAYHRAGGEPLELCLRTAQSLVDELGTLLRGEGRGDERYRELLAEASMLTGVSGGGAVTVPGLVSLLSRSLPGVEIWPGVGLARVSSRRVRFKSPAPRGGLVLAWPRSRLGESPSCEPLAPELLPPGVQAQAVILDQELETATPLVGQVLKAELFWEGGG